MNLNSTEGGLRLKNIFLKDIYGSYSDMFTRPYVVKNLNGQTSRHFRDSINNNFSHNAKVPVDTFANDSGLTNFVGISNTPSEQVRLPNGNDIQRLQVFMVVETTKPSPSGAYFTYIIQGYTSHHGVRIDQSTGGVMVDEDMDVIINSIMEFEKRPHPDPRIPPTIKLLNSYNTIGDFVNYYKAEHEKFVMSRGKDIHTMLSRRSIQDTFDEGVYVEDAGSISSPSPITSNRTNSDTSIFMSNILNGYQMGRALSSTSGITANGYYGDESVFSYASDAVREPIMGNNLLIRLLSEEEQSLHSNHFKISTIRRAFYNEFENVIHYLPVTQNVIKERLNLNTEMGLDNNKFGNPATTVQADVVTNATLEFNNSVTSIISSVGLSQAKIVVDYVSNMTPVVQILQAKSLVGDSYVPTAVNKAEAMIIMLSVGRFVNTVAGVDRFSCTIDINILTETIMQVSVPGLNYIDLFRFPTYCDSNYMPVLMKKNERNQLLNDIQAFCEQISYT